MSQGDSEEESNVSEEQSENAEPIITTRSSAILPSFRNHFYPRLHIANRLPTIQSTQPPTTQSPAATTRHRSSFSLVRIIIIIENYEVLSLTININLILFSGWLLKDKSNYLLQNLIYHRLRDHFNVSY